MADLSPSVEYACLDQFVFGLVRQHPLDDVGQDFEFFAPQRRTGPAQVVNRPV